MRKAFALARLGEGYVEPNPLVGALLVKEGRIIGQGYHRYFGGPHAEIEALQDYARRRASERLPDLRGAVLIVNVEPCATWGKTPPCTEAIGKAGLSEVVLSQEDPNPVNCGKGIAFLRQKGIQVTAGILGSEGRELNHAFQRWHEAKRPTVILKWAMSADGKIALASGQSQWITAEATRTLSRSLRQRVNAILVGKRTALYDNPQLLPGKDRLKRSLKDILRKRTFYRLLLDRKLEIPLTARLFQSGSKGSPAILFTSKEAPKNKIRECQRAGITVVPVSLHRGKKLKLKEILDYLYQHQVMKILVEGGEETWTSFLEENLWDELWIFMGAKLLGGAASKTPWAGQEVKNFEKAPFLKLLEFERVGNDMILHYLKTGIRE